MSPKGWEDYPVSTRPTGWIELTENGLGAVVAWFAGTENVIREHSGKRTDLISVTCTDTDGTETSWTQTITEADVAEIDDDIDHYLQMSGLHARPRGFHWYMRKPAGISNDRDFWLIINKPVSEETAKNPNLKENAEVIGKTIENLFTKTPHAGR